MPEVFFSLSWLDYGCNSLCEHNYIRFAQSSAESLKSVFQMEFDLQLASNSVIYCDSSCLFQRLVIFLGVALHKTTASDR